MIALVCTNIFYVPSAEPLLVLDLSNGTGSTLVWSYEVRKMSKKEVARVRKFFKNRKLAFENGNIIRFEEELKEALGEE